MRQLICRTKEGDTTIVDNLTTNPMVLCSLLKQANKSFFSSKGKINYRDFTVNYGSDVICIEETNHANQRQ